MHITEKLREDLSYKDLCDLAYKSKPSIGWFGELRVSINGFEGSSDITDFAKKILNKLQLDANRIDSGFSLKDRINATFCVMKIENHYNRVYFLEQEISFSFAIVIINIFDTILSELTFIFSGLNYKDDYNTAYHNAKISIRNYDMYRPFMKLSRYIYQKEYPHKAGRVRFYQNRMISPLNIDSAVKNKDKSWIRSNVSRQAILSRYGPNFFRNN